MGPAELEDLQPRNLAEPSRSRSDARREGARRKLRKATGSAAPVDPDDSRARARVERIDVISNEGTSGARHAAVERQGDVRLATLGYVTALATRKSLRHAARTQQVEPGASSDYETPVRSRANHVDDPRQLYQRPPARLGRRRLSRGGRHGREKRHANGRGSELATGDDRHDIATGALLSTTPEATPRAEIASWGGGLMA